MNFYKHYIGDFQRDTGHLSLTERGAYRALLDHHYATERPLPRDMVQLCRIVGAVSKADRDAVVRVLRDFWQEMDDGYVNSRAQIEIGKANEQRDTNRRIAEEREAKRKAARQGDEPSTNRSTSRATNRSTNASPIQTPDSRLQSKPERSSPDSCVISPFAPGAPARDPKDDYAEFQRLKAAYPPHAGRTDWITAERHARRHVDEGATWADLLAGVERYARHCAATGRMVLNPARFFGDPDVPWLQPWPIPPNKAQRTQDSNVSAAREWLEKQNAAG